MYCPYCETELLCIDYYGFYLGRGMWNKQGDIYKCIHENCESEVFNYHFYTDEQGELHEGYPC